jgi:hypothetical protein
VVLLFHSLGATAQFKRDHSLINTDIQFISNINYNYAGNVGQSNMETASI